MLRAINLAEIVHANIQLVCICHWRSRRQTIAGPEGGLLVWRHRQAGGWVYGGAIGGRHCRRLRRAVAKGCGLRLGVLDLCLRIYRLALGGLDILAQLRLLVPQLSNLVSQAEDVLILFSQPDQFLVVALRLVLFGLLITGLQLLKLRVIRAQLFQFGGMLPVHHVESRRRQQQNRRNQPGHRFRVHLQLISALFVPDFQMNYRIVYSKPKQCHAHRMSDPANKSAQPRLRLRLKKAGEAALRSGHPWLFADSIKEQNRAGELGELAVVYDRQDRFLAAGLFDPDSPIRLRVLQAQKPQTIDAAWWKARLDEAWNKRSSLFDERTTGYRWINGESDGFPGLVLDRYAETLVLKLYTAAWLPRLELITDLICSQLRPNRVVLRLSRNIHPVAEKKFSTTDGQILRGPPVEGPVIFSESGLQFEADVVRGQKTGFFLDQRENRRTVGTLAGGRRMLNAFSFSGGFSVYGARGGAHSVTDLDLSAHALEGAKRNFRLNRDQILADHFRHETVQADAFEWLDASDQQFDLIVLDPPSLARRESERFGAVRAYERLSYLALEHLVPDGILVACSCSAHVSAPEFFQAVERAAVRSRRKFKELSRSGHASDHPATFKEAQYLKAIFLEFKKR